MGGAVPTVLALAVATACVTCAVRSAPLQPYNQPVPIPAASETHFMVLNALDGSYHFGYDTGTDSYQSYREEVREPSGRVYGKYGYVDPQGVLRVIEYTADENGYRSRLTTRFLVNRGPPSFIGPIPFPVFKGNNRLD